LQFAWGGQDYSRITENVPVQTGIDGSRELQVEMDKRTRESRASEQHQQACSEQEFFPRRWAGTGRDRVKSIGYRATGSLPKSTPDHRLSFGVLAADSNDTGWTALVACTDDILFGPKVTRYTAASPVFRRFASALPTLAIFGFVTQRTSATTGVFLTFIFL
jgi:hypothetical protein